VGAALWIIVEPLQTAAAPLGILSFELAGKPFIVRSILESWHSDGQIRAAFAVGLGTLFALACWAFFSILCLIAAERMRYVTRAITGAGTILAWAQFVALAAFIAEAILLLMLLRHTGSRTAMAARLCAEAHYAILLAAGFYTALCFYYLVVLQKLGSPALIRYVARSVPKA
jgi:hypothetical protein